jgi:hypothetical protein
VYIPKAEGRQRPLGIATLEDEIVQRAVVEVLSAVYEADFRGFSYGFRSGRSPHDALDALTAGIYRKKGELGAGRGYPRLLRILTFACVSRQRLHAIQRRPHAATLPHHPGAQACDQRIRSRPAHSATSSMLAGAAG